MNCRAAKCLIAIALAVSVASPWALLQSIAWGYMLVKNSQTLAFKQAITSTFDGKHPCGICKAIETGRTKDREQPSQDSVQSGKELTLSLPPRVFSLIHVPVTRADVVSAAFPGARHERPPAPPPRLG